MNNIAKKILNRYLEADHIPYAILIDGNWGSGKTWYLKNKFEDDFKKKIIYTSANGITSLDDISQQVLYRKLYLKSDLVKDPKAKLAWGITKQIGKAIIEKTTGYNTDDAIKLGVDLNDFASLSKDEVLIIDDVERMNESISTEELLGYISTNFTEENSFKVIIVADEKQLIKKLQNEKETYLNIKEKTIWQSVEYRVDIPSIYEDLIKPYSKETKTLLLKRKEFLLNLFEKYSIFNLRWVLYYFQIIDDITKKNKNYLLSNNKSILLNSILIICVEYKKGNLNSRQHEEIPSYIQIKHPVIRIEGDFFSFKEDGFIEDVENKETTKEEEFSNLYLTSQKQDYQYFESVYKLTCFGIFEFSKLKREFKEYEKSLKQRENWHITLDNLTNLLHLEEVEFTNQWNKLVNYIGEDKYDIYDLRNIAGIHHTYSRIGVKFPMSSTDLYKLLLKQTKSSKQRDSYREDVYFHIKDEFMRESDNYKKLLVASHKVESSFITNNVKESIIKVLDKIKEVKMVEPSSITSVLLNSDKLTIKKLANIVTEDVKTINKFESSYNDSINSIKSVAYDNDKVKINLEYFLKVLINSAKRKNIIKFIVKRMVKTTEEKALNYWK